MIPVFRNTVIPVFRNTGIPAAMVPIGLRLCRLSSSFLELFCFSWVQSWGDRVRFTGRQIAVTSCTAINCVWQSVSVTSRTRPARVPHVSITSWAHIFCSSLVKSKLTWHTWGAQIRIKKHTKTTTKNQQQQLLLLTIYKSNIGSLKLEIFTDYLVWLAWAV